MNNNITEKVERYNEIGQVVRVSLKWRGKTYMLQMFFPGSKFPSRQEVEAQVKKIYPDSVVMVHYASETQPNQPLIRVTEGAGKEIINTVLPNTKRRKTDPNMTPDMLKRYRENMTASHEPDGEMVQESPYGEITSRRRRQLNQPRMNVNNSNLTNNIKKDTTLIKKEIGEEIQENETENPTFTQFMKRIDQLPEVTREAIKNCGNDPMIAKAALEISGIDK